MKKIIKLLLILLIPSLTQACLWLEGTTIDGEYKTFEDKTISSLFLKSSQHASPQKNFKQRFYRENNQTIEYLALQAIMQGNYDQGIEKLLQIEDENQNLYATASNLGTAYELKGDNVSAIKWIKEGINRDASSHYGTEWLHLLILETKLQLESNSTLLKNSHIISLPNRFSENTIIKIKEKSYTIKEVRDALFYQLKERLIFVKPKDAVVADLLYSFAKIEEQTTVVEEAIKLLKMAVEYGFDNRNEIDDIFRTEVRAFLSPANMTLFVLFFLLIIIGINRYLIRKQKNREKNKISISPISFAFSVNIYMLLVVSLSPLGYFLITLFIAKISFPIYMIFLPFYWVAISLVLNNIKSQKVKKPKESIYYTVLLYFLSITLIYFTFLKDADSSSIYYFTAHTFLAICIFFFLKWRMNKYE